MTITPINNSNLRQFRVTHNGQSYHVDIWVTESSKFDSWEVTDSNDDIVDGDLEDEIVNEICKRWDDLN